MCGLNLIINGTEELIKKMNNALSHRGVRSTINYYFDSKVHLGHIRLPIQGISSEFDHPMKINNCTGTFVGEIFNYKELDPKAKSDLPILIKAFQNNNLKSLDGFWAGIFIQNNLIYILIDHLAKKPLYIRRGKNNFLAISSEIKPLKLVGPVTMDHLYFSTVAKFGYFMGRNTPYNEIKKLPANVMIIIDPIKNTIYSHFLPKLVPKKQDIRKELIIAVKNRLVSDVPLSLLLSGGLDSTIIFELLKQFTKDFTVFHIDNEEREYLNCLDFTGIKVKQLELENVNLKKVLIANETPIDLGSMVPQYQLSKALKKAGLNTTISGDGADELFGGYHRINNYDSQFSDIFHELVYYHLPRLDKLMMANTVELRCPYLSRKIIEGALALPYKDRINKLHLKKIFANIVPKPILERKKKALKINEFKKDSIKYRLKLIELFKKENF